MPSEPPRRFRGERSWLRSLPDEHLERLVRDLARVDRAVKSFHQQKNVPDPPVWRRAS
jgi:hypothetical protein